MVPLFLKCAWLAIEIIFWAVFHAVLVPKANQRRISAPYRAPYQTKRHLLLRRILLRVCHDAQTSKPEELRAVVTAFLISWFRIEEYQPVAKSSSKKQMKQTSSSFAIASSVPLITEMSTMSSSSSETGSATSTASIDDSTSTKETSWTIPNLYKPEMDDFLSWAFFAKETVDLNDEECVELNRCYEEIFECVQLTFEENAQSSFVDDSIHCGTRKLVPLQLSLEQVQPLHRPLAVYLLIYVWKQFVMVMILQFMGFQRVVSESTGLKAWYRPSRNSPERMPLIFFHGIAPAGILLYLPMVWGLLLKGGQRPCILVDNPNISCTLLAFDSLTEEQTVRGVHEIVEACFSPDVQLAVCGHSFGSCPITWLLNHDSSLRKRIRQCVLIDPVTLLLSDPAVMINFLYSRENSTVRLVASSELFTEYYLRRHFNWYNSELWLDEILSTTGNDNYDVDMHVIVALSELDEIVDAPKVQRHADLWVERQRRIGDMSNRLQMVYWKDARHASCVSDPRKWRDLQTAMLQSELELLQKEKQLL